MNQITVAGIISQTAIVRYTKTTNIAVANFSIADNQGGDKEAIFWAASLFGKRAESLSPYLITGVHVTVTGSLIDQTYIDNKGVQQKPMSLRVSEVALQGGKRADRDQAPRQPEQRQQAPSSGFADMDSGDIPF